MNTPKLLAIACVAAATLFTATPARADHWRHHHAYYYSRPYYYSYYRPHYYHHYRPYVYYDDPYYRTGGVRSCPRISFTLKA